MDTTREAFTAHWRRLWERMENGEETADNEWAQLVSLAGRVTGTRGTETGESK